VYGKPEEYQVVKARHIQYLWGRKKANSLQKPWLKDGKS